MNTPRSLQKDFVAFQNTEVWLSESLNFFSKTIKAEFSFSPDDPLHIILSGGNTPLPFYRKLSELNLPWNKIHFWLADERCVLRSNPERSEVEIKRAIGDKILSLATFHSIPEGDPGSVAEQMEGELKKVTHFVFSILGIGADGHTASLFPGFDIGSDLTAPNMIAVYNSPKPPANRVSLSLHCINRSAHVLFLTKGQDKKKIIEAVLLGADLPATKVQGNKSSQIYFCME
ncbi:6-phosphogluconolactonase [Leptospira harrisiae]|uniref:6-phosphogluconolactonase n=1 Tax=Leptospira harrisiae TaxID=2023189 RepID=A0A2N0APP8_9LEPT|nr:6-phosphogluconolactonase [Leptospira harrisiae]PJZ86294.1 6-phosphogluconolactonase [Leptospira harrisiae]PKA09859.1 6-phosphogluconolactonase [Leptospira harrisiae]